MFLFSKFGARAILDYGVKRSLLSEVFLFEHPILRSIGWDDWDVGMCVGGLLYLEALHQQDESVGDPDVIFQCRRFFAAPHFKMMLVSWNPKNWMGCFKKSRTSHRNNPPSFCLIKNLVGFFC